MAKIWKQATIPDWIKTRLNKFIEGIDYIRISEIYETRVGKGRRIEYFITIETAKNIAMMENNDLSIKFRLYFIKMEEIALSEKQLPKNYIEALECLLQSEKQKDKLQIESNNKQEIIDEFITIHNSKNYTEVAKLLHFPPMKFINELRSLKYIKENREPYQKYIDSGYFIIKYKKTYQSSEVGNKIKVIEIEDKSYQSYLITSKGFQYFSKKFLLTKF